MRPQVDLLRPVSSCSLLLVQHVRVGGRGSYSRGLQGLLSSCGSSFLCHIMRLHGKTVDWETAGSGNREGGNPIKGLVGDREVHQQSIQDAW